jgi:Sec-independent protein translocase protein TatA
MKVMGGTEQFTELFKNMAKNMGGMGKNMRMDTNALNRMTKQQSTRERLLKKLEAKRKVAALENEMRLQTNPPVNYSLQQGQQPNNLVFKLDGMDNQEKSYIHPDILAEMENESKKPTEEPKKKSKKKKGKK